MWKQKIGMSVGNAYSVPTAEVVRMLARIGFDAVSPVWDAKVDLSEVVSAAKESGLEVQSLHAPYHWSNRMWNTDEAISAPAKEELLRALEDCRRWEIPVMVVGVWANGAMAARVMVWSEKAPRFTETPENCRFSWPVAVKLPLETS